MGWFLILWPRDEIIFMQLWGGRGICLDGQSVLCSKPLSRAESLGEFISPKGQCLWFIYLKKKKNHFTELIDYGNCWKYCRYWVWWPMGAYCEYCMSAFMTCFSSFCCWLQRAFGQRWDVIVNKTDMLQSHYNKNTFKAYIFTKIKNNNNPICIWKFQLSQKTILGIYMLWMYCPLAEAVCVASIKHCKTCSQHRILAA